GSRRRGGEVLVAGVCWVGGSPGGRAVPLPDGVRGVVGGPAISGYREEALLDRLRRELGTRVGDRLHELVDEVAVQGARRSSPLTPVPLHRVERGVDGGGHRWGQVRDPERVLPLGLVVVPREEPEVVVVERADDPLRV